MSRVSSRTEARLSWPQLYLGVAFTSLATLLLELSLTRIYSVVFYYHFAFLAISLALFGLGAGGVFSYYIASRGRDFFSRLGVLAALNGIAVVLSLAFIITRPAQMGDVKLALIYFASAIPFFLSGTVLSLAIGATVERVNRVYFFDLTGASVGCLALVPLLNLTGGPNTVIGAGVLFAVSAALWFNLAQSARGRVLGVVAALAVFSLIPLNWRWHILDIHNAKGQKLPPEMFVKWNSFSRIAIVPQGGGWGIVIDADAATGIAPFDVDHLTRQDVETLLYHGPGFAYVARPAAKTLIIGPGGGWDVARAFASGSRDITGVEINPIIATTIMREKFPHMSHDLYLRPEVHIHVEDGRSFVRRTTEKYQVLQATLVDTWASTAAGAFALSENNLYTTDAFYDYLDHLTPDGLLSFTRWGFKPPRESLRLLTLASVALKRLGETEPWRHIAVIRENAENINGWGAQDTVLIFRRPMSDQDIARIQDGVSRFHFVEKVYLPGDPASSSAFAAMLLAPDPHEFRAHYQYDVSAVSDDRPFFFYTVQPRDVWNYLLHAGRNSADYKINKAVPLLFGLVGISIIATIIVLALPPMLLGSRLPAERGVRTFLWYFVCIGAGYILIQVALIQKFVLFLGHPTYALTVIIFSMLLSSGLGSYFSRGIVSGLGDRLRLVLLGIAGLIAILAFIAAPLTQSGVALPLAARMLITVVLIAPAGFLMGMPFPTGLGRLEQTHPRSVRWAWALNAASSVLGSAGAIFLALYLGLRVTLLIGAGLYLGAMLFARLQWRAEPASVPHGAAHSLAS
ncbi:MAG TPA: hypothetical protein VFA04_26440 [Bryobacteraceae bacterium]|nr:hypothetical protein [Bryobacteraceae bacterium]